VRPGDARGAASALLLDRFKCYRSRTASGEPRFAPRSVEVADLFESKDTRVLKPAELCVAAAVDGAPVLDAAAALACYRIKDGPGQPKLIRRDVDVDDAYGSRTDALLKATSLCVPSSATLP
jgi:hypothetical protein